MQIAAVFLKVKGEKPDSFSDSFSECHTTNVEAGKE